LPSLSQGTGIFCSYHSRGTWISWPITTKMTCTVRKSNPERPIQSPTLTRWTITYFVPASSMHWDDIILPNILHDTWLPYEIANL
jgi:hypothetical protein